jgi:hypothetical protein
MHPSCLYVKAQERAHKRHYLVLPHTPWCFPNFQHASQSLSLLCQITSTWQWHQKCSTTLTREWNLHASYSPTSDGNSRAILPYHSSPAPVRISDPPTTIISQFRSKPSPLWRHRWLATPGSDSQRDNPCLLFLTRAPSTSNSPRWSSQCGFRLLGNRLIARVNYDYSIVISTS